MIALPNGVVKNGFQVICFSREIHLFTCSSDSDRDQWIDTVRKTMEKYALKNKRNLSLMSQPREFSLKTNANLKDFSQEVEKEMRNFASRLELETMQKQLMEDEV